MESMESALCYTVQRSCRRRNRLVWNAMLFSAVSTSTPLVVLCIRLTWCLIFITCHNCAAVSLSLGSYCTRYIYKHLLPKKNKKNVRFPNMENRFSCTRESDRGGLPSKDKTRTVLLKLKRVFFTPSGCVNVHQGCCKGGMIQGDQWPWNGSKMQIKIGVKNRRLGVIDTNTIVCLGKSYIVVLEIFKFYNWSFPGFFFLVRIHPVLVWCSPN